LLILCNEDLEDAAIKILLGILVVETLLLEVVQNSISHLINESGQNKSIFFALLCLHGRSYHFILSAYGEYLDDINKVMRADERNDLLLGEVLLLLDADVLVLLKVSKVCSGDDYVFMIIGKTILELGFGIVPCCGRCC
jgi:hypothetical protein